MIVLLDCDEVIRATNQKILEMYNKEHGTSLTLEDLISWHIDDTLPLAQGAQVKYFFKLARDTFLKAKPIEGSIDAIHDLKSKGHTIHIVTNQHKESQVYTLEWLRTHKVPYDALTFTSQKHHVFGHYLVDDDTKNLVRTSPGFSVKKVCFDRPWNRWWTGKRIYKLGELSDYIGRSV